jgi:hypothetical protein
VTKLRQGMEKLEPYRPTCMTIDVERLLRETGVLLQELEGRGGDDLAPFTEAALPVVHRA